MPLLLIGYENHKIEIHVRLHNESENTDKVIELKKVKILNSILKV